MPRDTAGLGYSPFDRLYWGNRCYFLLLRVLRCFSSPRSPHASRDVGIAPDGLPHSDIRGSMGICPSPRLFAACHVLLRLREPRHPPCALIYVPYIFLPGLIRLSSISRRRLMSRLPFQAVFRSKRSFALLFVSRLSRLALHSVRYPLQDPGPFRTTASIMSLCPSRWRITESNR